MPILWYVLMLNWFVLFYDTGSPYVANSGPKVMAFCFCFLSTRTASVCLYIQPSFPFYKVETMCLWKNCWQRGRDSVHKCTEYSSVITGLHMHSSASVTDTNTLQKSLGNKAWKKYYFNFISLTRFPNLYWDRLLQANNMLLFVLWNNSLQEILLSLFFTDWKQNSRKVRMCSCSVSKRRRDETWPLTQGTNITFA